MRAVVGPVLWIVSHLRYSRRRVKYTSIILNTTHKMRLATTTTVGRWIKRKRTCPLHLPHESNTLVRLRWKHDSGKNNGINDWTKYMSKSMKYAIWSASGKATSVTKDLTQKASERLVSSSQEALKSSKGYVGSKINEIQKDLKSHTEQLAKQVSEKSQSFARNVAQGAAASSQKALRASRNFVGSKMNGATESLKSASVRIAKNVSDTKPVAASQRLARVATGKTLSFGKDAARQAANTVTESVKGASAEAAKSVKTQIKDWSFSLERILRSAAWWGLGAIFVYGMAQTLPVEIFRYVTRREDTRGDSSAYPKNS